MEISDGLNAIFGVTLALWSYMLHGLQRSVDRLGEKFEALTHRLEQLATRVTVVEVQQGIRHGDD